MYVYKKSNKKAEPFFIAQISFTTSERPYFFLRDQFPKYLSLDYNQFQKNLKVKMNVEITQQGSGAVVKKGDKIKAHYTGKLSDGQIFDSSVARGQPLEFTVGVGQVIKGWDEGFVGLAVGTKGVITCPPDYAYGAAGAGGVIPPNATLIFEIEVVAIC